MHAKWLCEGCVPDSIFVVVVGDRPYAGQQFAAEVPEFKGI